jgi:hypothetical protein
MLFMQMMRNELMESTEMPWLGLGSFTYNATSFHCYNNHWSLIFDDYHNEVWDKFELLDTVTWQYIMQEMLYLPSRDMSLDGMWTMVDVFKQENFVGGKL